MEPQYYCETHDRDHINFDCDKCVIEELEMWKYNASVILGLILHWDQTPVKTKNAAKKLLERK